MKIGRRCREGYVEVYDEKLGAWMETEEECNEEEFKYTELGFKDKKEYINHGKEAQKLWKKDKRKIIYEDELTNEEKNILLEDVTLSRMIQQKKAIDEYIVKRINMKLAEIRGGD